MEHDDHGQTAVVYSTMGRPLVEWFASSHAVLLAEGVFNLPC